MSAQSFEQIHAAFHDGITSDEKQVVVNVHDDFLEITGADTNHIWVYGDIEIEERPSDGRIGSISSTNEPDARLYLPSAEFKKITSKIPRSKSKALRLSFWITAGIACIIAAVFFVIPALAPIVLPHMPKSWDEGLGEYASKYFVDESAQCNSLAGNLALNKIGSKLGVEDNDFKLNISVQRSEMINAFALPGGRVLVHSALIDDVKSQEELIGVLAHEAAHVHFRHGSERMLRSVMTTIVIDTLTGGAGSAVYLGSEYMMMNYGQDQESAADLWAVERLAKMNVEPSKMADFFTRMELEMAESEDGEMLDKISEYVSTHPSNKKRAQDIEDLAIKLKGDDFIAKQLLSDKEWQDIKQICN